MGTNGEKNGGFAKSQQIFTQIFEQLMSFQFSVRLKSNIKAPRGYYIIKSAEIQLLNERIRTINNTLEMYEHQRDTCMDHLSRVLDKAMMEECKEFINKVTEAETQKDLRMPNSKI